ncbi:MAG: bifunctional methylenetetrahydrofolate dehydrogenase/methenyltetrahydrofolate cyclohydrolase FolD [Lentisphaeria bacterium]|nr:bifunctional methylenetetrahydrofolate dehydrogenase/methenyltetrahydrofolate cyclohydrolase FolD [Lentisphaeria bacterium]MBR7119105.1 bifunctional methylenetetrahydrofolate dehydrogenase/methenyltetrahydrofolate cyclohydrolase FolD [Lentisphaeria bacterium]
MAAMIIDGKAISAQINSETAEMTAKLKAQGVTPGLAVILVGNDPASQVYVRNKVRTCEELGFESRKITMSEDVTTADVIREIEKLNNDPAIHGILVQSPPPPQIDEAALIDAISPDKDADCFNERNVGRVLIGHRDGVKPCTPWGVMELLKRSGISLSGKHAVVIGRSNIVGKPLAAMLMQKSRDANATVTVVHSGTKNLAEIVRQADVVIAAIGKANFVTADMVKEGAVVIDVGINRVFNPETGKSKLTGDVDFESVKEVASAITPVPGGVGPMTIAMLMRNTVDAAARTLK